ncbi:MAG: hypothetical protein ABW079_02020 [Sedimenticola sp.]
MIPKQVMDITGKYVFISVALLCISSHIDAASFEKLIKPGHWFEVEGSHMRQVAPCGGVIRNSKNPPKCDPSKGDPSVECYNSYALKDISHIVNGWSGGAFDEKRQSLLIFGGGHKGWAGNDIYSFSLETFKWHRISDASCLTEDDIRPNMQGLRDNGYYSDNTPRSFHTYNSIQYLRNIDSLCRFSGGDNRVDCYNISSNKWTQLSDIPGSGIGLISAVNPINGEVWVRTNQRASKLLFYNPRADNWKTVKSRDGSKFLYNWTAAIDPHNNLMLAVGGKRNLRATFLWNLEDPPSSIQLLNTKGDLEIEHTKNPGLQYDPTIGKFVAWRGGTDIFIFDIDTLQWIKHSADLDNRADPGNQVKNGTYGRFRYSEKHNVYVLMNGVDSNVYLYRIDKDAIAEKLKN